RLPYVFQRNKGCYPGQEVIERINTYGKGRTARVIRVFQIEGKKEIPKTSEILTESGEMAGNISSSAYNPFSDKTLVMGTLEAKFVNNTLFVQSHPLTHLTT
ncbi:MAG: hypothetical protein HY073_05430, partial [Deltaproteobacteria bacterium]|nr:hypothetical protein [Deltaproteobacteria bacterium]